eukprot:NODE_16698_length_391_cov_2.014925_g16383_i0.p4 GENE.NODE_16698_length_391_cov_2.014925_g16383_i0~~NODE_16698_length_391_cov_2.014925_g16383_i0.p4  ORF type:complete len:113 (-),score=30.71 NODE_16698_length_391_cov_2.014925_g16383_i0:52-390(-)
MDADPVSRALAEVTASQGTCAWTVAGGEGSESAVVVVSGDEAGSVTGDEVGTGSGDVAESGSGDVAAGKAADLESVDQENGAEEVSDEVRGAGLVSVAEAGTFLGIFWVENA